MSKPNVLVLGGLGFIGRNFVEYLVDNNLAGKIRIADKGLPQLVGLSKKQNDIITNKDLVDCKQLNLAREAMVQKAFEDGGTQWDIVVNLAGETKYSQTEEVYKENIIDVSVVCGKAAAARKVGKFIEVSTAQIYDAGKKPSSEEDKQKPWTKLASAKQTAEEELKKIQGLNLIIVRPCTVYGPGDVNGITPRLIVGAVYKHLNETMEFLWDKDLKLNTVHVEDVCAGLWFLASNGKIGDAYNLADSNDTDQGSINKLIEPLFKIKTDFMGNIKSKLATTVAMKTVAETANEKHLKPWSELCKSKGITNTPLTPYLDEELLYNNSYSVDGTKITKLGFTYKHPNMTQLDLKATLDHFTELGFFPKDMF